MRFKPFPHSMLHFDPFKKSRDGAFSLSRELCVPTWDQGSVDTDRVVETALSPSD